MFTYASFALACITFFNKLNEWAYTTKLMNAGEARAVAAALKVQADEMERAYKARDAVRTDLERHPDKLRQDDKWRRD